MITPKKRLSDKQFKSRLLKVLAADSRTLTTLGIVQHVIIWGDDWTINCSEHRCSTTFRNLSSLLAKRVIYESKTPRGTYYYQLATK